MAFSNTRTGQQGSVLLEALISILIFSFGVLAIMGFQAAAIINLSEAKYRSEAGFYANRLLGEMWTADRTTLAANFATGATKFNDWKASMTNTNVSSGLLGLPGVAAHPPTVTITPVNNGLGQATSFDVAITVNWQSPNQPMHKQVVFASLTED